MKLATNPRRFIGTFFKEDGKFENRAQVERVKELMTAVRDLRAAK